MQTLSFLSTAGRERTEFNQVKYNRGAFLASQKSNEQSIRWQG